MAAVLSMIIPMTALWKWPRGGLGRRCQYVLSPSYSNKFVAEDTAMFMRQLSYLIALDKHRHFGRAAESCHVSQPALSTGISELERELGITIIKRNRSFRGITPEGERVIAWARQMLESLQATTPNVELKGTV
jgi:hypothetical protein